MHRRDFPPYEAAGYDEATAFANAHLGETMRDLVVAGGLRGFTVNQMFPERAV